MTALSYWTNDTFVSVGNSSTLPYNVSRSSWDQAVSHPNASYTQPLGTASNTYSRLWQVSIAATGGIPVVNTSATGKDTPQVFTGIEVDFAPTFSENNDSDVDWEACLYFNFPGIPLAEDLGTNQDTPYCDLMAGTGDCAQSIGDHFPQNTISDHRLVSCPSPSEVMKAVTCGTTNQSGWDLTHVLAVNKTSAAKGGTLFRTGSPLYDQGDLNSYGVSVNTIWPIFSYWNIRYGTNTSTPQQVLTPSFACLFPNTISNGSFDFLHETSTSSSSSAFSFFSRSAAVACVMILTGALW